MPRTTINIDAAVLRDLKRRARRVRRSMGQLASELLAHALRNEGQARPGITWLSQPMGARVDIDDKEALYRALEER
jgi:hypothetical protein